MKLCLLDYFGLFLFLFSRIVAANNLIPETCTKCTQKDPNIAFNFCVTSLQADPHGRVANLNGLGSISIKLTTKNATDTKRFVGGLLKDPKLNPNARGSLRDCLDLYSDAISTLDEAIKDYNSKHYTDANVKVSSVLDVASTCEDGFKEKRVVSPLSSRNNNVFQLSAIALSIINMMKR